MDRPDFGIGKLFAIRWTKPRLAYVKHWAEQGLSAAEIALKIDENGSVKGSAVSAACQRNGIRLQGRGGRPPHRPKPISIVIDERYHQTLGAVGVRHNLTKAEVADRVLGAAVEQGEGFIENLLDLGGAG